MTAPLAGLTKTELAALARALRTLRLSVQFSSGRRYDHLRDVVLSRGQARALLRVIEALDAPVGVDGYAAAGVASP